MKKIIAACAIAGLTAVAVPSTASARTPLPPRTQVCYTVTVPWSSTPVQRCFYTTAKPKHKVVLRRNFDFKYPWLYGAVKRTAYR